MVELKVVKNNINIKNDNSENVDSYFIIQITTVGHGTGYLIVDNGKDMFSKQIIPPVKRFPSYKEAKKYANKFSHCKIEIFGRHKIEKLIAAQGDIAITVPINEVKEDVFCVSVFDKDTKEKIGYISINDKKQYLIKKNKDGIAFWSSEKDANDFITQASELLSNHPNLRLESEKLVKT